MSLLACGCRHDDVLDEKVDWCAEHQGERYARLAWRVISAEFIYRHRPSFGGAIPDALKHVDVYAAEFRCDVARLRAAIQAEARSRGIAA